jgi:hypothetical protein
LPVNRLTLPAATTPNLRATRTWRQARNQNSVDAASSVRRKPALLLPEDERRPTTAVVSGIIHAVGKIPLICVPAAEAAFPPYDYQRKLAIRRSGRALRSPPGKALGFFVQGRLSVGTVIAISRHRLVFAVEPQCPLLPMRPKCKQKRLRKMLPEDCQT